MKSRSISNSRKSPVDVTYERVPFAEKVFLYMGLSSITVLFLGFTAAFLFSHFQYATPGFRLPVVFHINTAIIILSSLTFKQAMKALKADDPVRYRLAIGATFGLGLTFLGLQYFGWHQLMHNGISLNSTQSASYVYLVSSLHAFHVLGGVVALAYCLGTALWRINDPVKQLLFDTNPVKRMRIGLLHTYWNFVDGLWLYLYVFFMVMLI